MSKVGSLWATLALRGHQTDLQSRHLAFNWSLMYENAGPIHTLWFKFKLYTMLSSCSFAVIAWSSPPFQTSWGLKPLEESKIALPKNSFSSWSASSRLLILSTVSSPAGRVDLALWRTIFLASYPSAVLSLSVQHPAWLQEHLKFELYPAALPATSVLLLSLVTGRYSMHLQIYQPNALNSKDITRLGSAWRKICAAKDYMSLDLNYKSSLRTVWVWYCP